MTNTICKFSATQEYKYKVTRRLLLFRSDRNTSLTSMVNYFYVWVPKVAALKRYVPRILWKLVRRGQFEDSSPRCLRADGFLKQVSYWRAT